MIDLLIGLQKQQEILGFICRYNEVDYSYNQEMIKFKRINWPFTMLLTVVTRNGKCAIRPTASLQGFNVCLTRENTVNPHMESKLN